MDNSSYVQKPREKVFDSDNSVDEGIECIALVSEVNQGNKREWVVDSAASAHMCNDRRQIRNLKRLKAKKSVKVGNGSHVKAIFEGTVKSRVRAGNVNVRNCKSVQVMQCIIGPRIEIQFTECVQGIISGKENAI